MDSVRSHYESLLAPVYAWLAGGAEAALAPGGTFVLTFRD